MANWLDGLSTALTAGTKGASGWLEGQQRGRKEADDRAKEIAAQLRQKRLDEQNALWQNTQMGRWKSDDERQSAFDKRQGMLDVMGALKEGYQPLEEPTPMGTGSPLDAPFKQIAEARSKGSVELGGRKFVSPLETPTQRAARERTEDKQQREGERKEDRTQRLREIAASRADPSWVYGGVDPATGSSIWVNSKNPDDTKTVGATRPVGTGGRGSVQIKRALAENKTSMALLTDASREIAAHPAAVGLTRAVGIIPGFGEAEDLLNQNFDPKGVPGRASLANIGSLVIHKRSGAAVTVSEFPRLRPFIPTHRDSPQAVQEKIRKLKQAIQYETDMLEGRIPYVPDPDDPEDVGGDPFRTTIPGQASPRVQGNAAPSFEEWLASKQRKP